MSDSRRSRVTVTLGRGGRVVNRAGLLDEGIPIGMPAGGGKRSIRDRLGGDSGDRSKSFKRQRGESSSTSIDMCLGQDDLRFKLLQKNTGLESGNSESLRCVDLREKLSSRSSRPSADSMTMRPPESAASTRHPVRDPRDSGMMRHPVLGSRDTGTLGRFPPLRNPSELSVIGPPRSYSSWNLENLRRRSPEPLRHRSPVDLRHRSPVDLRQRSPVGLRRRSPGDLRRRSPVDLIRRSPEDLRRRSPGFLRRRSPEVMRRRSPEVMRRRSPEVMRRRSPEVMRRRSPQVMRRRSPERLFPPPAARGLSPPRSREDLQRRPLINPYDEGRSTSYLRISPTRAVRSSPYLTQSSVPAPPMNSVVPISHYSQPGGIMQKIPTAVNVPPTVDSLLESLGLEKYAIFFKAEEVDMNALRQMGDSDLKDLGIPMGPRKKLLQAVAPRARRLL